MKGLLFRIGDAAQALGQRIQSGLLCRIGYHLKGMAAQQWQSM